MSFITIDVETFYRSKKTKELPSCSLKTLTYEGYIDHPEFKVFGFGIKIDNQPTYWIQENIKKHLQNLFPPGNQHTVIAHNAYFEAAVLEWVYGVQPLAYRCTQSMSNGIWAQASASLDALTKRLFPNNKALWKGKELETVNGVSDPTPEQMDVLAGYCIQDVDITFEAYKAMYAFYPERAEEIIDLTMRMWARRPFVANHKLLEDYLQTLTDKKEALLDDFLTREGDVFTEWVKTNRVKQSKTKDTIVETVLAGRNKFPEYLDHAHGITIPKKHSPTPKNPDNMTWALGKKDLQFLEIQKENPHLKHIWDALMFVRGDDIQRTHRLLLHSKKCWWNPEGRLAVPLKVNGAHTKRFSGMNSVNFQNFKQKSPHRLALTGGQGNVVIVGDLSNIEARVTVWFCGQDDKVQDYRDGVDPYNKMASKIFGRPVDRKRKEIDENGNEFKPDEMEGHVGKFSVLGLGFGMGWVKAQNQLAQGALGGPQLFFDDHFVKQIVHTFRADNPEVIRTWKKLDRVIYDMACGDMQPYDFGCLHIEHRRIRLPSGLYLTYPNLRKDEDDGNFQYWGGEFYKNIYGGLLMENIAQSLAAIINSDMLVEIDKWITPRGGHVALTVHDEIVVTAPEHLREETVSMMETVMSTPKDWYSTIPLATEVAWDKCYSK